MAMAGMAGSAASAGSFPVLALVLALFTVGYALWTVDRLTSLARAGPPHRPSTRRCSPRGSQPAPGSP